MQAVSCTHHAVFHFLVFAYQVPPPPGIPVYPICYLTCVAQEKYQEIDEGPQTHFNHLHLWYHCIYMYLYYCI